MPSGKTKAKPKPKPKARKRSAAARRPNRGLRDLERGDLEKVAKASYARFGEIGLTDRAATLAYYGFLSLFPALIVSISLLALFGTYPETYESIIDTLRDAAPGTAVDTIDSALEQVFRGGGAGSLLGFGLLFSLVTASGAVGASIRALEAINGTRRSATFVRSNLTRLWLTLALMALFLVAFAALLVAGPLFGAISEAAGLGDAGRTAVSALRYPVGFAALLAALLLLYTRGPAGTAPAPGRPRARRGARRGALGDRVGGVLVLRRQLRLLQRDLRGARRDDHPARLDLRRRGRRPDRRSRQPRAAAGAPGGDE